MIEKFKTKMSLVRLIPSRQHQNYSEFWNILISEHGFQKASEIYHDLTLYVPKILFLKINIGATLKVNSADYVNLRNNTVMRINSYYNNFDIVRGIKKEIKDRYVVSKENYLDFPNFVMKEFDNLNDAYNYAEEYLIGEGYKIMK
jgi:hypothetical protein